MSGCPRNGWESTLGCNGMPPLKSDVLRWYHPPTRTESISSTEWDDGRSRTPSTP